MLRLGKKLYLTSPEQRELNLYSSPALYDIFSYDHTQNVSTLLSLQTSIIFIRELDMTGTRFKASHKFSLSLLEVHLVLMIMINYQ